MPKHANIDARSGQNFELTLASGQSFLVKNSTGTTIFEITEAGDIKCHKGYLYILSTVGDPMIRFDSNGDTRFGWSDSNDRAYLLIEGTEVVRWKKDGDIDGNGAFNDSAF